MCAGGLPNLFGHLQSNHPCGELPAATVNQNLRVLPVRVFRQSAALRLVFHAAGGATADENVGQIANLPAGIPEGKLAICPTFSGQAPHRPAGTPMDENGRGLGRRPARAVGSYFQSRTDLRYGVMEQGIFFFFFYIYMRLTGYCKVARVGCLLQKARRCRRRSTIGGDASGGVVMMRASSPLSL